MNTTKAVGAVVVTSMVIVSIVNLWSGFSIIAALFLMTMLIGVIGYGVVHIQNKRDFLHIDEHSIVFRNQHGHVSIYDKGKALVTTPTYSIEEAQATLGGGTLTPMKQLPIKVPISLQPEGMSGDDAILGVDATGQQVSRPWKKLKNILVLGLSGGGKSNTMAFFASQNRGKIALIDKHGRAEDESLYGRIKNLLPQFALPVGLDPTSAMKVIEYVRNVLESRLAGAPNEFPLMFMVDELTATLNKATDSASEWQDVAKSLMKLLEDINVEGRKVGVRAVCAGQAANASRTGGTEVRDLFNTRIYHVMREKQAIIVGMAEYKQSIKQQGVGMVTVDTEGEEAYQVQVPLVPEVKEENEPSKQLETKVEVVEEPVSRMDTPTLSLVDTTILKGYRDGLAIAEIATEIYPGATSPTAKATVRKTVEDTLRKHVGGLLNESVQ